MSDITRHLGLIHDAMVGWKSSLESLSHKENFMEIFITKTWYDLSPEYEKLFKSDLVDGIKNEFDKKISRKLVPSIISFMDLFSSLQKAMDGETSLAPKEYFYSLLTETENIVRDTAAFKLSIDTNVDDAIILNHRELVEVVAEPGVIVSDDMVQEIVEIESADVSDKKEMNAVASEFLPKQKKKKVKKYDSGLHRIDPSTAAVVSLAGKRKTKDIESVNTGSVGVVATPVPDKPAPKKEDSFSEPKTTDYNSRLSEDLNQIESLGVARQNILKYLSRLYYDLTAISSEDIARTITELDSTMEIISGDENNRKAESVIISDETARRLARELTEAVLMSSPGVINLDVEEVKKKDTYHGEIRVITININSKRRIPGFVKGQIEYRLFYLPSMMTIEVEAMGIPVGPPFNESRAVLRIPWNETAYDFVRSFVFTCFKSALLAVR
ncbi:MAG: hypothetical protein JXR95_08555 [Deltaproteobacteria bacterium]|nr:hypothetical protein [Deltaproteobacteria bacterium]